MNEVIRVSAAEAVWLVCDWLEDAREKLLVLAGRITGP